MIKEKIFFFKNELIKPGSSQYYRQLMHDQHLSLDEIEMLNWTRTLSLVQYAFEHVPYYRKRYTEIGCTPQDIKNPDDFCKLPILTRQDLMNNFEDILSDEACLKDVRLSTTGGSTGTPAKVYHPKKETRAAHGWRMLNWWNISPADDWASVWRDVNKTYKSKLLHFLQWFPTKHILLNATSFTEQDIKNFLNEFIKVRPKLLHGYVGTIDFLADYIIEHGIQIPPPKAIWLTSAPITHVQRKKIETAFHAPVYDQYGCCEIYWLAAECPLRNGLHMFYDTKRFEFLDENNHPVSDGDYGNIVVTEFQNYLFPLIRYAVGDSSRRLTHTCTCGCNLPLMDSVKGRVSDTFILPSKARLNALTTIFDNCPEAVRQFQLHQQSDASIVIRVVPNNDYPDLDNTLEKVRVAMAKSARYEVPVLIEKVSNIPIQKGKLKFVISDYKG